MNRVYLGECELSWSDDTLWLNSSSGNVLRIVARNRIVTKPLCTNIVAHADMIVDDPIEICVPESK